MPSTLTKDRTLIAVSNMPGDWATCTDPTASRTVTKRRRSATSEPEALGGRLEYDDVTVARYWDQARDAAVLAQYKRNPDFYNGGTLTLTGLGPDGVPLGAGDAYTFVVQSMSRTGADANSGDEGMLTVVLSVYRSA